MALADGVENMGPGSTERGRPRFLLPVHCTRGAGSLTWAWHQATSAISFPAAVALLETIEVVAYGEAISPPFPSDPAADAKDVRLMSFIPAARLTRGSRRRCRPAAPIKRSQREAASAPTMATPRARVARAEVDDQSRHNLEDCHPREYPTPGCYCAIGCCDCCCGQIAAARAMAKDLRQYIFCDNLGGLEPWQAGTDETWSSRGCISMPLLPKAASRD